MRAILNVLIRAYQISFGAIIRPCCRYYPSCSSYAREAVKLHGPFSGSILSIKRVLRCNPFSGCGYDPVPVPKNKEEREL